MGRVVAEKANTAPKRDFPRLAYISLSPPSEFLDLPQSDTSEFPRLFSHSVVEARNCHSRWENLVTCRSAQGKDCCAGPMSSPARLQNDLQRSRRPMTGATSGPIPS